MILPRGEPFFHRRGDVGCLLVHGLTGAPEEMRWMGEHLASVGYSVLGVRLFGHATQREDLRRARWQDWWASVEDGYHLLRGSCSKIVLIGLSLGGVLSLAMASSLDVVGLVAMSAPFVVPDPKAAPLRPILPALSLFWPYLSPPGPSDWHDRKTEQLNLDYRVVVLRTVAELHDLLAMMRAGLPLLEMPTLLIHAREDGSVPPHHAEKIFDRLGCADKQLLWLENSGHNIPRDAAREVAFQAAENFIRHCAEVAV
jgi:carboxylesterase